MTQHRTSVHILSDSSPRTEFQPESLIARRYIVVKSLGEGAGGRVYLCKDKKDDQKVVAVKVLNSIGDNITAFERFYREAKMAQEVVSPYVVRSFDVVADDGIFAYTMEYIPGQSLTDIMQTSSRLSLQFVATALCEIAHGLVAIHKAGIIHRDLKPSNVLVTPTLHFKIADFGVAHLDGDLAIGPTRRTMTGDLRRLFGLESAARPSSRLTSHGELLGTIDYMSPEYLSQGEVGERSDLYSLGTLAFELLTGRLPFEGGDQWERLRAHVELDAPEISLYRSDVPSALSDLIMSCLDRNPDYRPPSATTFLHAISDVVDMVVMEPEVRSPRPSRHAVAESTSGLPRDPGARWQG